MAAKYWLENPSDNNFSTAANWDGGVAPVNGDDVYILAGNTNISGTDESGTELASFHVGPGYTGQIGDSANDLQIDADYFELNTGGEELWIETRNATGGDYRIEIGEDSRALASGESIDSKGIHITTAGANDADPVYVQGGAAKFEDSADLGTIEHNGGYLEVGESAASFDNYEADGSAVALLESGPATLCQVNGGTVTHRADDTCATVRTTGGRLNWEGGATISTTCDLQAGEFNSETPREKFTITPQVEIKEATVKLRGGIGSPTLTAGYVITGDGSIQFDRGASFAAGPTYPS